MNSNNSKLIAYVGTYTNSDSKGIYKLTINRESRKIENVDLVAELDNPTYLTIDKTNKYLYSTIKVGDKGGVAAFSIDNTNGALNLINYQLSKGSAPCHVNLDNSGKYLFAANYHKGLVEVFPLREDGGIETASSTIAQSGFGPKKERQEKSHVHYVGMTPDEKNLCAIDLGTDELVVCDFQEGDLLKSKELSLFFTPGSGPRHMDFHPNRKFAYIVTELSGEIITLEYCTSDSSFKAIQYISTLPKDFNFENLGSAIHISLDGKYLYSSNRGHDSIAIFSIDVSTGMLQFVSHISTEGNHPRDFQIDPTGSLLLVANMNSNNIVTFKIDKNTGMLTKQGEETNIPSPVCVKFLNT
jgi:6-phosphogluconolactonase